MACELDVALSMPAFGSPANEKSYLIFLQFDGIMGNAANICIIVHVKSGVLGCTAWWGKPPQKHGFSMREF